MSPMQISLVCCTDVILNEIARKLPQKSVASTYAMAIVSESRGVDTPDWSVINQAILDRWSMSGLERIKARAWNIVMGKVQP